MRHGATDYLEAITSRADIYRPVQEEIFRAIDDGGAARVVDLCSGGGGPWLSPGWRSALEKRGRLNVLLTDKFPSEALCRRLTADPQLSCVRFSVDAACVPEELRGFRTIFSSFHHFPDTVARAVLADAVRCGDGFAMAEVTSRTLRALAIISLMPIFVWLLTPRMRPFRWSRLLLTYLLPLIPLVVLWDGLVSCCRTRTPQELLALTAGLPEYEWSAGYARGNWLAPVYLMGRAKNFPPGGGVHLSVQETTAVQTSSSHLGPNLAENQRATNSTQTDNTRRMRQYVWGYVSRSPLRSLWNLEGIPARVIAKNTWNAFFADNLVGRSAELGFYFLFALFPTLITACAILGLAARSAAHIYESLLQYLALVVPPSALGTVMEAFNQTTAAASSGKLTFGLVAALWSASVGFSAIQTSLNIVYRVTESRQYWRARLSAIGVTIILSIVITLMLASLLAADFLARLAHLHIYHHLLATSAAVSLRMVGWLAATAFLSFIFALIYYFGPDVKVSHWHWLTPGSAIGMLGWVVCSLGLRIYVHYFNNYSATYGSLGTVIILLTWFYLSGLMLLLGGEINSEIEAAVQGKKLAASGALRPEIVTPGAAAR